MTQFKGAIFDLDGTLLDSMHIWQNVGITFLKSRGIQPRSDFNEAVRPLFLAQVADYLRSDYGLTDTVQEIVDGVNHMLEHLYISKLPLKNGVLNLLQEFRKREIKMCVATATDRHLVEAALSRNGILDCFGKIFTCTEVGAGKDKPDIYLRSLAFLGTDIKETIVFEDAYYAIQTAKSAGFSVAAVYDETTLDQKLEIETLADVYIKSFSDWVF